MPEEIHFAGYPAAVVSATPEGKAVQQLLWGDFVRKTGNRQDGWVEIFARGTKGWVEETALQSNRILEVVFVDIGQGDGCLVVSPDDKQLLVDAGQGDNMRRFLRWRFNKFQKPSQFEAIVISHPDADHYKGFDEIFDETNVRIGTIYHNGIVERAGDDPLGPKADGFLTDIIPDHAALAKLLAKPASFQGKQYPTMLNKALSSGRVGNIRMLAAGDKFMPGFTGNKGFAIEVLGPVVEPDERGNPRLRWLKDVGKTKNGHSVVLRLRYNHVSILLGGDLNIPSEQLLLSHHTKMKVPPTNAEQEGLIVEAARKVFQVDIAKACHHGSADFSDLFLQSLNPIATIISSGDAEPHAHPRADSLGTVGKFSRGARPLVFSTELSRSAAELVKHPHVLRVQFREAQKSLEQAKDRLAKVTADKEKDAAEKAVAKAQKAFDKLVDGLERSVAVFGAINVRTDGEKVVIAYKIERPSSPKKKWDVYQLEPTEAGILRFVSQH
jgi:beta-lactamase superfamily II metal-dependent hydrolase